MQKTCAKYLLRNAQKIGGPGTIVELAETCFRKRKNESGQSVRTNQWMCGGIERATKSSFLVLVEARNAQTLLTVIQDWIHPGSTIVSDLWGAYGGMENLPQGLYFISRKINVEKCTQLTSRLPRLESKTLYEFC